MALAANGWTVRVLARRDPIDPLWRGFVPQVVIGDLSDERALRCLAEGADALIHCAGLTKARSREAFFAVNRDGARRVAEAARAVPTVVLVSSLAAREPHLSDYAASKREGESAMAQVLGERLTIARPAAVYGPGDREISGVFLAAERAPALPVLNAAGRIAMIHVADCAAQIAALAEGIEPGRTIALTDARPEGYAWRELMTAAAAATGRRVRLLSVPAGLVRLIGITNDFSRLFGAAPMLTAGKARELLHKDWSASPFERSERLPRPIYGLEAGFAETVGWLRAGAK